MPQGASLAAMLRGAGSMGNPQDAVREATKRAFKRGTLGNRGIADGADPQMGAPGLPPQSGASGLVAALAAVPVGRKYPKADGGGNNDNPDIGNPGWAFPDGDPNKRPRRGRRAPFRTHRGAYDLHRNDGVFRGTRGNKVRNS